MEQYTMHRVQSLFDYRVVNYWQALLDSGLIRGRLYDVVDPKLQDVKEMLDNKENVCYIIYDEYNKMVCADTMLNGIRGLMAQVHFSIHPDYRGEEAIKICRSGSRQHFKTRIVSTNEAISTLYGITPLRNKLAISLIKKVGFKPICNLDRVCYFAKDNRHYDGLLTMLRSDEMEVE